MKLVIATSNPHKVREFAEVLTPLGIEVLGLDRVGPTIPEPVEDAETFEGNARIKALAYASALGMTCVAEDSGLEVDALGGAPGVYSARYADAESALARGTARLGGGREARDRANNQKLLRELGDAADRSARFVCAICMADAQGSVLFETRGSYEGTIVRGGADDPPRGANGFGYDPLLYLPDVGKTSAELTPHEKHARSHRGQAARALAAHLSRDSSC